jgi:hypothetical protein
MILSKNILFKHQNKVILVLKLLNSRTWKTLKSTVVIFQVLETSPASLTSAASATSLASTASRAPILVIFCGMDHQKSNFSLIYGTLSDGGC